MKIGVCGMQAQVAGAAAAGLDYIELSLSKLQKLDEAERAELRAQLRAHNLPVESFNQFYHGEVSIYGDEETALRCAEENLRLAAWFGGKVAVVGSGKARAVPEGMKREDAQEQFLHLMDKVGNLAAKQGVKIAIEPLNYGETNFINTVTDCMTFCRRLGNANVGCMVDFYHFFRNGESLDELDALRPGELFHAHLARPNEDRGAPLPEDAPTVALWAQKLRQIGYNERITMECGWFKQYDERICGASLQMQPFRG